MRSDESRVSKSRASSPDGRGVTPPISEPFPINPQTSASPNAGQPLAMQKRVRQTIITQQHSVQLAFLRIACLTAELCRLDHVGPARVDAEAFDVACGAVRHLAPAPDQNCRTRRRDEDDHPRAPADIVSGETHFPLCARTNPASRNPALRHLTGGA